MTLTSQMTPVETAALHYAAARVNYQRADIAHRKGGSCTTLTALERAAVARCKAEEALDRAIMADG